MRGPEGNRGREEEKASSHKGNKEGEDPDMREWKLVPDNERTNQQEK